MTTTIETKMNLEEAKNDIIQVEKLDPVPFDIFKHNILYVFFQFKRVEIAPKKFDVVTNISLILKNKINDYIEKAVFDSYDLLTFQKLFSKVINSESAYKDTNIVLENFKEIIPLTEAELSKLQSEEDEDYSYAIFDISNKKIFLSSSIEVFQFQFVITSIMTNIRMSIIAMQAGDQVLKRLSQYAISTGMMPGTAAGGKIVTPSIDTVIKAGDKFKK